MPLPRITIEGRVVADPELRFSASGVGVCNFTIVASDRKKNEAGVWEDSGVLFQRCAAFKTLAENCAESIQKGDLVTVVGKLSQREWTDKEGAKRTSYDLAADSVSVSLQFRVVPHGAGKAERGSAAPAAADPWAGAAPAATDEPPF